MIHKSKMSTAMPAASRRLLERQSDETALGFHMIAVSVGMEPSLAAMVACVISQYVPRQILSSPYGQRIPFGDFDVVQFALRFRFASYEQLERVVNHLQLPPTVSRLGFVAPTLDALAVTLARFACGTRLQTLAEYLHICWSPSRLSAIITGTVEAVVAKYGEMIKFDSRFLESAYNVKLFSDAIAARSRVPLNHIVGFVDGTCVRICRPTEDQDAYYNGNERCHVLHFQGVMAPNGIMMGMFGPYPGTLRHCYDVFCLTLSLFPQGPRTTSRCTSGLTWRTSSTSCFQETLACTGTAATRSPAVLRDLLL